MNCDKFREKLFDDLGQLSLTPDEKEHIELCAECRLLYEELTGLEETLDTPEIKMTDQENRLLFERLDKDVVVLGTLGNYAFRFVHVTPFVAL